MTDKFINKDSFLQKAPPLEAKEKVLKHIYTKNTSIFTRVAQYSKVWVSAFALLFVVLLGMYFHNLSNTEDKYKQELYAKIDSTQMVVADLIDIANQEDSYEF